jgi:hypothetical protein
MLSEQIIPALIDARKSHGCPGFFFWLFLVAANIAPTPIPTGSSAATPSTYPVIKALN